MIAYIHASRHACGAVDATDLHSSLFTRKVILWCDDRFSLVLSIIERDKAQVIHMSLRQQNGSGSTTSAQCRREGPHIYYVDEEE